MQLFYNQIQYISKLVYNSAFLHWTMIGVLANQRESEILV